MSGSQRGIPQGRDTHGFITGTRDEATQAASRGIEGDGRQGTSDRSRHPRKHTGVWRIGTGDETEVT